VYHAFALGKWDGVLAHASELLAEELSGARVAFSAMVGSAVAANVHRGQLEDAGRIIDHTAELETSSDAQERASYASAKSLLLRETGDPRQAFSLAESAFELRDTVGLAQDYIKESFVNALDAALALDDLEKVDELLTVVERIPPGRSSQFFHAQVLRFRGRLASRRAETDQAERRFKGAAALFREIVMPFYLAATRLEHAEWLSEQGRAEEAEPLFAEAREIFERLGATPWLERAGGARAGAEVSV
jgi:tetratricopeptide (TPR) repeat protein